MQPHPTQVTRRYPRSELRYSELITSRRRGRLYEDNPVSLPRKKSSQLCTNCRIINKQLITCGDNFGRLATTYNPKRRGIVIYSGLSKRDEATKNSSSRFRLPEYKSGELVLRKGPTEPAHNNGLNLPLVARHEPPPFPQTPLGYRSVADTH